MTDEQRDAPDPDPANDAEDDETPEEAAAQTRQVPPPPELKPDLDKSGRPRRRGRPSGPIGRIPAGVGNPHDADMLWLDVLRRIAEEGIATHEMVIEVARTSPGPYYKLGSIEASSVAPDESGATSAADMLREAVIDQFHLTSPGPATYDIAFVWKRGHTFYDRGTLKLPSMREINAFRNAAMQRGTGQTPSPYTQPAPHPPVQPPHGFGAPYGGPYGPQGYGQPPPQQEGELAQILREMRQDQARLTQRVEQIAAEQRHPAAPAAPAAPPQLGLEAIAQVAKVLEPFGLKIIRPEPAGVAAPPRITPPPPIAAPTAEPKTETQVLAEMLDRLEDRKTLEDRLIKALGLKKKDEEPEDEEEEKEPDDKPGLGFFVHEVPGAHWPDGTPMQHATDDKGNWNLGGLILSNPYVIKEFGGTILGIAQKFMPPGLGGLPPGQQPGQQQQQQQQQQQRRAHVEPPPEPAPNGKGKPEWDL
jgi:hypothetical protein